MEISYTRALDHLIVVRDDYSDEPEADDADEEFDDEFTTEETQTLP